VKALFTLLVLLLLAATSYSIWQLREIHRSVEELRVMMERDRARQTENDQALSAIARTLAQARDAASHADWTTARSALERAETGLEELGRTIGQKTAPTVHALQEQAAGLLRQVQDHLNQKDQKQSSPGGH